ncbi:MAG: GNAT family N-acetyltransferase [Verrucomicrobia bacterium]|nr:GNAT family N-acetyltransferase [Verrucomicrobiota bacterium]
MSHFFDRAICGLVPVVALVAMGLAHDYRSLILLAGDRYRLVPLDLSFDQIFFDLVASSRQELSHSFTWCTPGYTVETARAWLQSRERARAEDRAYDFVITRADNGELVGACGINQIQTEHRLGNLYYWVAAAEQGRGAATAGVSSLVEFGLKGLGLIRLEMLVPERNFSAERVAEKVGATREVLLRNRLILQARVQHAYLFSVLGSPEALLSPPDPRWEKITVTGNG